MAQQLLAVSQCRLPVVRERRLMSSNVVCRGVRRLSRDEYTHRERINHEHFYHKPLIIVIINIVIINRYFDINSMAPVSMAQARIIPCTSVSIVSPLGLYM